MKSTLTLPLFCLMLAAHAATPEKTKSDTPGDYAYALPLQVSGKQGVVGLRLPVTVYEHARTAELRDLRIFDAQGKPQPFALHHPATAPAEQRITLNATIFPVKAAAKTGDASVDIDIRTRADGSVIGVHTRSNGASSGDSLRSLILDFGPQALGKTDQPMRIDALRFTPPPGQKDYTAEVWLETSSDLKQWQTAGASELRWLTNDNAQTLASDRLEFPAQHFRYARLTWRRGAPQAFASIQAEAFTRLAAEPVRDTLWIRAANGKHDGDLAYAASIAIPVEQVQLRFAEPNIVYPVSIGRYVERPSRHTGKPTEWAFVPQSNATFYQITQNGDTRRSGAIHIGNGHADEWVIRPQATGATARPELGLFWQAATLVFLAGGTPPYTLSLGRADADPAAQPLNQVAPNFSAQELGQIEQAVAGALQTTTGLQSSDSNALQASIAARQRSYVLWGVLVLGVLILGGLAWRLVKQMNAASRNEN